MLSAFFLLPPPSLTESRNKGTFIDLAAASGTGSVLVRDSFALTHFCIHHALRKSVSVSDRFHIW